MSTLTHRSGHGWLGPAVLCLLLAIILMASLRNTPPPPPPPDSTGVSADGSGAPPPPDWRWGDHRDYKKCPGKAIQHVLCRHGSRSTQDASKFNTNSPIQIRRWVDQALRNGELQRTRTGWKVVHTFGRTTRWTAR